MSSGFGAVGPVDHFAHFLSQTVEGIQPYPREDLDPGLSKPLA